LIWYFIVCALRFATRTSDSKNELFWPAAWPTPLKISASGGGALLPLGVTGVTRLTLIGTGTTLNAWVATLPPVV
jgi:hypothetical protein